MKITTLVDNLVYPKNLLAEHGLSFYIEIDDSSSSVKRILFDCGQTTIFAQNAHNLDIDLKLVDAVIISHGHYDHTGGLEKFLEINKRAKVYIKKEALLEKQNHGHYIGIPKELSIPLERTIFPTDQITKLSDYLYLASFLKEMASAQNNAKDNSNTEVGFSVMQNGEVIKDCFNDEQYLVYINNNKISLITGCSHKGIQNIVNQIEMLFKLPVIEIIGGLHTQKQTKEEIEALAQYLNKSSVQSLRINHCTGVDSFAVLQNRTKCAVCYNYAGNKFKSSN